jgi:hypothetical protein
MQLNKILFQLGHNMIQLSRGYHAAAIIVRIESISLSVTVNADRQNFIGTAAKDFKHKITVIGFLPVPARGTAMSNSMAAETFQLFPVFFADDVFREINYFGHVPPVTYLIFIYNYY